MGLLDERADLDGKVAIVTGGAGGLGESISRDLVRCGVEVALCDRDAAAVDEIRDEVALAEVVDVRDPDALAAFFAAFDERFDRLDILVNVPGGTFRAPFTESNRKGWDTLIRTNFTHVIDSCSHAIERMRAGGRGGSIVNLTTIEAHRAAPNFAVYSGMKAAVAQFARTMSVELGPEGIRINNVAPDITPTPGMSGISTEGPVPGDAGLGAQVAIPMGRMGVPDDVTNCVLFLASALSSYVTGTTLHPDGGALASSGWFNWPGEGFRNTVPGWALDAIVEAAPD